MIEIDILIMLVFLKNVLLLSKFAIKFNWFLILSLINSLSFGIQVSPLSILWEKLISILSLIMINMHISKIIIKKVVWGQRWNAIMISIVLFLNNRTFYIYFIAIFFCFNLWIVLLSVYLSQKILFRQYFLI